MIGIYKITSPKGKIYIGQSAKVEKRLAVYKRLRCDRQPRLYNSLIKYGVEKHKFEIVTECEMEDLGKLEVYYQELFNCTGKMGLNCIVGSLTSINRNYTLERRLKCGLANLGRKMSPEAIEKNRIASTGRRHTKESKMKMSKVQKGKRHTEETKEKIRLAQFTPEKMQRLKSVHEANKGRIVSSETKLKMSMAHKGKRLGKTLSEETKKKIVENSAGKILVINIENGVYFNSVKDAAQSINMSPNLLTRKLSGWVKSNNTYIRYAY